ncbi:MAG: hypothetical protein QOG65_2167, partial [Actinomycetota bacterium]|nr:hypothetical protein [Actinomycetota bacterium]
MLQTVCNKRVGSGVGENVFGEDDVDELAAAAG